MNITGIIWLYNIVEKLQVKHGVEQSEVSEVLDSTQYFRFVEKGHRLGENVYLALGQTHSGRYLTVLFIHKQNRQALILSARDMVRKERRQYGRR